MEPPALPQNFADLLLDWYKSHQRDLPWRNTRDPYKIWLSEIILQQTRVQQGLPYYQRFTEKYPTVQDLAQAPDDEVLRLWQGLGYYSRARNMHQTAKEVAAAHGGKFPSTYQGLLSLKGVGNYTAAAIASFAFGEKVAVVDGNVYRVLARTAGLAADIAGTAGQKAFAHLAASLVPDSDPGTYNQAIMEFGALHCKPANPECMFCPFGNFCHAKARGMQQLLPVKQKKNKPKKRVFHYLVFVNGGTLLMGKRPAGDIWQGLYDFPLAESAAQDFESLCQEGVLPQAAITATSFLESVGPFKHLLTHQHIAAYFHLLAVNDSAGADRIRDCFPGTGFWSTAQAASLPKPVLIVNFLKNIDV